MSRDFRKARRWQEAHRVGDAVDTGPSLKCGHRAVGEPAVTAPQKLWWCCGGYQKQAGR